MGKINCNGADINYRSAGSGKKDLVLVHGLATSHAFWHLNLLLPLAKEYRVTVFDLRGHGYSEMTPSGYTTAEMAEDLHCLFNGLGIERAHIVGHSYGGTIALNFAKFHPERIDGLVVADSRVRAFQPEQRLQDWPDWEKVDEQVRKMGLDLDPDEKEVSLTLLERLARLRSQESGGRREKCEDVPLFIPFSGLGGGVRSAKKWVRLLDNTTAREDLLSPAGLTAGDIEAIRLPTLAFYGEKSTVLSSLYSLERKLPYCRTVILPGVGHFHPLLRPKIFAATVLDYLADIEDAEHGLLKIIEKKVEDKGLSYNIA